MAERAMVFETSQIGVEALATPGTAVQATKTIAGYSVTVTPNPTNKTFTPKGYKFPTVGVPIKEQTDIKVEGIGTYNEMVYPLASVLTDPVITTPGGGTLSRLWTYTMNDNAPDSQRTFSMEVGSNAIRAFHIRNCLFTEFGLTFSRKDVVKIAGAMLGQIGYDDKVRWLSFVGTVTAGTFTITVGANTTAALAFNATASTIQTAIAGLASVGSGNVLVTGGLLTSAPMRILFTGTLANSVTNPTLPAVSTTDTLTGGTSLISRLSPGSTQLSLIPISPVTIDMKLATTQAGLAGAALLTRDFQFTWKLSNRDSPFFPMNSTFGAGFGGTVEADPKGECTLDLAADDIGMANLANIRTGTTVWARISALGPLIEGSLYHSLQIDTAIQLTKISDFKDVDGSLLGNTYSGEWVHDPTAGYATKVILQNTLTAL
jgi:hypothetical protein